jgi:2-dehydro-3-deoxyphosphogluconate aldolase/(4S)-4-hydroxy-2-oxoglutarate aldolase
MGGVTEDILKLAPVIPVLVIDRLEDAVPLARALYAGGLPVLEITLRTPVAAQAISLISEALPEAVVGAGTVLSAADLEKAVKHNAAFAVSPGVTDSLLEAAGSTSCPLLPGVATPSEAMRLLEKGIQCMKFFPAEAAGGIPMLKSIHGPLPSITFCPTGGIAFDTAPGYLALPNVACVGGTWMVADQLVKAGDWQGIEALSRQSAALAAKPLSSR